MSWLSDYWAMAPIGRKRRMTRAAGIASTVLICHPETWDEIQALAGELRERRTITGSAGTSRSDGLAEVALSGVALATLLQAMREAMKEQPAGTDLPFIREFPPHRRAVARRVYLAVARTVQHAEPGRTEAMPPIVLDDRAPGTAP